MVIGSAKMFKYMLEKLSLIAPVLSLIEKDNQLTVVFNEYVPSEEEEININNILSEWPVEKLRSEKENDLNYNWTNKISEGWITPQGWKVGLSIQDITLLNGAFTLGKEASNLGLNTPISIIDTNGVSHELNLTDLTQLMLAYGQARSELSNSYASKINQIKTATSVEELNNLNLTL